MLCNESKHNILALIGKAKKLSHFRFNKPGRAEQKQISIGVSKTIENPIKPWRTWVISMGVSKPSNPTKAFEMGDCSWRDGITRTQFLHDGVLRAPCHPVPY
jgi:hypothetical protein